MGRGWSTELVVGAGMVFLGSAVFSLGGNKTMTSVGVQVGVWRKGKGHLSSVLVAQSSVCRGRDLDILTRD